MLRQELLKLCNTKYQTVRTVPKSNRKIIETVISHLWLDIGN